MSSHHEADESAFDNDPFQALVLDEAGVHLHITEVDNLIGYGGDFDAILQARSPANEIAERFGATGCMAVALSLAPEVASPYVDFYLDEVIQLADTYAKRAEKYTEEAEPLKARVRDEEEEIHLAWLITEASICNLQKGRLLAIIPPNLGDAS